MFHRTVTMVWLAAAIGLFPACKKWLGGHAKVSSTYQHHAKRVDLVQSVSHTPPHEAVVVTVSPTGVWVEDEQVASVSNGRVDRRVTGRETHGRLIFPLFFALQREAQVLKAMEKQDDQRFVGELLLFVDSTIPFRQLRQVLYTAQRAEFRTFQLVVKRGATWAIILVELLRRLGPRQGLRSTLNTRKKRFGIQIEITGRGYAIRSRHGPECPEGTDPETRICFPTEDGEHTSWARRDLKQHLWHLFASKYKDPSHYATPDDRHAVELTPSGKIPFSVIVRTLDALREIPRDPRNPRLKVAIPRFGCALRYDQKSSSWGFAERDGVSVKDLACMYHQVYLNVAH